MTRYSVVGLGKLGASMAAAIASRGLDVVGIDVNRRAVDLLNEGRAPVQETDLEQLIQENLSRLRGTSDFADAVLNSDVTFVVVPTPSDDDGAFSIAYAEEAFHEIGRSLARKTDYHLVVLTSTVLPGATRYGLIPVIERASGKVCGRDFGVCYSPEFIALGSVIRDFLHPDFTLIGQFDDRAGELLQQCYSEIMKNSPPVRRMSLENAELTKIALNSFVTTKITFANMLATMCERIPGGDVETVSDALGLDHRIGRSYLTGGMGFGGPCFPRDNVALGFVARALDATNTLPDIVHGLNEARPDVLIERLQPHLRPGVKASVLGLSYKPLSHVIEQSHSTKIVRRLLNLGVRVTAYDPLAGEAARAEFGESVRIAETITDCVEDAEIILLTTPDQVFRALTREELGRAARGAVFLDVWRLLDPDLVTSSGLRYMATGRSSQDALNASRLGALWGDSDVRATMAV
ncbi:UDP-glucose/GDP-mannose dehydrogenase family protein [Mycobacterium sp. OAE908]|uniref:UDP-glucose dehydrogenase family protein n=1 Tax=Mycobacterium sp. OAE908 TaxID=2817899 RepID=UPI001AE4E577